MERICNTMLLEYSLLYYEGGVANAYFWDKDDDDFGCCVCVKKGNFYKISNLTYYFKDVEDEKDISAGGWSSINLFDVVFDGDKVTYKLMTTVVLEVNSSKTGTFEVMGNVTKKYEKTMDIPSKEVEMFHLVNICSLVEHKVSQIRQNDLNTTYLTKSHMAICGVRYEYKDQAKIEK